MNIETALVMLETVETSVGLKVYLEGIHVKTMPIKFEDVVRKKHIINPRRKRLTKEERFNLEVSIFERALKLEQPFVYNLIKRSSPKSVRSVYPMDGPHYFLLEYKNGRRVKCPKQIYDVGHNIVGTLHRPQVFPNLQTSIV
ncbi:hypothetical protein [Flagellimonas marina]|uniref:Uncharacterized protein n=1 Tax=Flagellimonas marina TaxID=1775168 RepID=A0ABV8PGJ8_9FLAO